MRTKTIREEAIENITCDREERFDEVMSAVELYYRGKIDAYRLSLMLDEIRDSEIVSLSQRLPVDDMVAAKAEQEEALVS